MTNLVIHSFEGVPGELATGLASALVKRLSEHFGTIRCSTVSLALPEKAYSPLRMQHLAGPFLESVVSICRDEELGLGLVDLDLYVPRLNFIFGVAARRRAAIVALPRLRQGFYGEKDDDRLFKERLVKESVHELGHVLGLEHCSGRCVMRFSNSLSETDARPDKFCMRCHTTLQRLTGT